MCENFVMKLITIWNWDMLMPHTNSVCALTLTLDGNLHFAFGGSRVRTCACHLTGVLDQHGSFFYGHDMNYHEENQVSGPRAGGIFPSLLGKLLLCQVAG